MRRKFLALLLCFTMIFSFGLTACGYVGACTHNYTEETFLQASCISEGVLKKTCSLCGMEKCEKTEKTEHKYQNGICETCNTADPAWNSTIIFGPDDPSLDLVDCKHSVATVYVVEPTCNQLGYKLQRCNDCDRVTVLEGYPATGEHIWEEIVEEPTCTVDGVVYNECEQCGTQQFVELLKKLGHNKENGVCTRCEIKPSGGNSGVGAGVVETPEGMVMPMESVSLINDYGFYYNTTLNCYYEHSGLDFAAEVGASVCAVEAGTVERIYKDDLLLGTEIVIDHGDGLKSVYRFVTEVEGLKAGDQVQKGQVIATVAEANGNEYKDGAHLHFEIIKEGKIVDPTAYLTLEEK